MWTMCYAYKYAYEGIYVYVWLFMEMQMYVDNMMHGNNGIKWINVNGKVMHVITIKQTCIRYRNMYMGSMVHGNYDI